MTGYAGSLQRYAPLLIWVMIDILVVIGTASVHFLWVESAREELEQLETEWIAARQQRSEILTAIKMNKQLQEILLRLPVKEDFLRLPLALSEEASRNHVHLPSLTYGLEKAQASQVRKAVLSGPMTGRYEDIRHFIGHLEASTRLLFIEDLDVGRSVALQKQAKHEEFLTVNLKLATYVRGALND